MSIDPRLTDPQKLADALDAAASFMEATSARGADRDQQAAIARFREAWPPKPETPTPVAEHSDEPTGETLPAAEQSAPT